MRAERAERIHAAVLLVAALVAALPAAADVLRLANGNELEGRIVEEDATEIVLETGGGRLRIPRADVIECRRESEGRTVLQQARRWLALERPARAVPLAEQALALGEPQAALVLVRALTALAQQQIDSGALPSAESSLRTADAMLTRVRAPGERSALAQAIARTRGQLEQRARLAAAERQRAERAAAAGQWLEAARACTRATALDQTLSDALAASRREACRHAGLALLQEGRYAEAALWLQRSLETRHAPSPDTLRALGLSHIAVATLELDRHEVERAIRSLEAARALGGGVGELAALYHGLLEQRRGHTGRARRAFRAALGSAGATLSPRAPLEVLRTHALERHQPLPLAIERFLAGLGPEAVQPGFAVEHTEGSFTVRADDRERAVRVAQAASNAAAALARWWPPAARPAPVTIHLLPDEATLRALLGSAGEGARGVTRLVRRRDGRASVRLVYLRADAPSLLEEVVPHEIVHALGPGSETPLPLWLEEGLAQATVEPERRAALERYRHARASGSAPALEDLFALEGFGPEAASRRRHYDAACAAAAFLAERAGGPAALARLVAREGEPARWLPALDLPSVSACEAALGRWIERR